MGNTFILYMATAPLIRVRNGTWAPPTDPLLMMRNLKDMITTKLQHSTYLVSYIWFATKENKWEKKKNLINLVLSLISCTLVYRDLETL